MYPAQCSSLCKHLTPVLVRLLSLWLDTRENPHKVGKSYSGSPFPESSGCIVCSPAAKQSILGEEHDLTMPRQHKEWLGEHILQGYDSIVLFPTATPRLSEFHSLLTIYSNFANFFLKICVCVNVCKRACNCGSAYRGQDNKFPGITDTFQPPAMGAVNQTWILWKSNNWS